MTEDEKSDLHGPGRSPFPGGSGGRLRGGAGKGTLRVGVRDDIMNFGYLNEDTGKYYGLEIDLAAEMAERMGYSDAEYVTVTPDTRKDMLLAGDVDAACMDKCIAQTYMDDDRMFLETKIADQDYGVATQKGAELSGEVKAAVWEILDSPFYKGVVSLGDNSVNIRVMVLCAEADRIQMERDLNREMKLLFDKYNINIPYPQIVVNKPATFQEATVLEKYKSQQFAREQREASGGYVEEDEEEN